VIYLDSSVVLASIFAEDASPRDTFWDGPLISSRLLLYEVWNRIHAQGYAISRGRDAEMLLEHVELIELSRHILDRVLQPFPIPVRTLDALHLATMIFLRQQGQDVVLASYDHRLLAAAHALGVDATSL